MQLFLTAKELKPEHQFMSVAVVTFDKFREDVQALIRAAYAIDPDASVRMVHTTLNPGDAGHYNIIPKPNKPVAVCGICGATDEIKGEGGLCAKCGGDHWVELDDFANEELGDYIKTAITNLNTSWEELLTRIKKLN